MDNFNQIKSFPITVYGDLEKYNEVTSKARCRIFYKGLNRNASYISDEFAEKLVATLPYTPVKGIYEDGDFQDHGESRQLGRIYGIVPENPNFAWEEHEDEDGVVREYACVDVYLFTALYAEAGNIVGKAQSMELYDKSIQGEWAIRDGKKCFEFKEACFLGLQVLGEQVEPCFEGSAFFNLSSSLSEMIEKIEEYNLKLENNRQGGKHAMPAINYKLSDREKFDALWSLLNENYTEEGGWAVDYEICEIYDDYALVKNYSEQCFERVYYEKSDEENSLHVCGKKKCYVVDVTESELSALKTIQALNQDTYEKIDELYTNTAAQVEALTNEKSEFELKISEYETKVTTLESERDELTANYTAANELLNETKTTLEGIQEQFTALQAEHDSLVEYKKAVEKTEKEAVIESYSAMLGEDTIAKYTEAIDNYTALELDKELAYELKNSNPQVFSKKQGVTLVPKDETPKTGIEAILSKYQK